MPDLGSQSRQAHLGPRPLGRVKLRVHAARADKEEGVTCWPGQTPWGWVIGAQAIPGCLSTISRCLN